MDKRLELHKKLIELTGLKNIYYQAPENIKMEYPCIKYSLEDFSVKKASNKAYIIHNKYSITVISTSVENALVLKLLSLPMVSFDRQYVVDGLYHSVLTIYI